ncbi:hypothetical protein PFICI_06557 [Pestalotiopsis fici W106-1]|uniref:Transcription factor domain-containing protein n=1 Tax=Pestalotiopsis fici (strain W106-1 / CGMCC3.15140) TaxID=1229662 RepID=W3X682_PESFW|nr:uncharacterized protein PFICI_06557 [Pestalotiopsis fici W106-1]ETS81555.1 hypothetical protein PFICI_06557 [Pestalotiopsis fici W106-1]
MQELLTEAVNIPFVLEQFDLLPTRPSGSTQTHNNALQDEFRVLLKRLHSWKATYASKSQGPLYWSYPGDRPPDPDEEIWLWFDNVVVANALTHYWAFTAICLVHIQRLRFATNDFSASSTIQTRAAYVEALSMICRSIPFLFEESHELYGPSSVAFLLSTVVSILNWDEELYGSRITINQNLVEYAKDQGFCWVS